MLRLPLLSTLFPYTTLFRSKSNRKCWDEHSQPGARGSCQASRPSAAWRCLRSSSCSSTWTSQSISTDGQSRPRSEEHTSELQSRGHLVCRLLLEKKNTSTIG